MQGPDDLHCMSFTHRTNEAVLSDLVVVDSVRFGSALLVHSVRLHVQEKH